jgi:hypothetical protein
MGLCDILKCVARVFGNSDDKVRLRSAMVFRLRIRKHTTRQSLVEDVDNVRLPVRATQCALGLSERSDYFFWQFDRRGS